jgi:hypothetical protein
MTTQLEAVIASNEATEPEYRIPTEGLVINEATIVRFKKIRERIKGDTYAAWVVLARRGPEAFDPYVVWNLIARPEGWSYDQGDYYKSLTNAEKKYDERTKWID